MAHDFVNFPELTNNQMQFYYFESPHKQITEGFNAKITRVIDGDTVKVITDFRDFSFKVRLGKIASPEVKEEGGEEAKKFLENRVEGEDVFIDVDPNNRVGKWGRIIGEIFLMGQNINYEMVDLQLAVLWKNRKRTREMDLDKTLEGFTI